MTSSDSSAGWGSGSMVIGGAILLILLFGIFGGNGWGGGNRGTAFAAGELAGFTGATPMYSATDRDQWMGRCQTSQEIAALSARSDLQVATILDKMASTESANLRDALNKAYMDGLAKDAKIDALGNQMFNNGQFNDIRAQLCQLGFALAGKPNTPPFVINGGFAQPSCCPSNCFF